MHPGPSILLASLACAAVTSAVPAQCHRPIPPPGGHQVDVTLAVTVTYSDGYQSVASMQVPDRPPPSCGWPLVVYVHPLGGSRGDELDLQQWLVGQGYAVWSYDVRAQAQANVVSVAHPGNVSTLWGPVERYDLAEQVASVAADPQWQGVVDVDRLAVLGTSQGGGHAWAAAALSGQALQLAGRTPITFPEVDCVIVRDLVGNTVRDWVRNDALFSTWWLEAMAGSYAALPLDAQMAQDARAAFVAQDPSLLTAAWQADGRDLSALLASSTVPLLYDHAYFDLVSSSADGVAALASMQGPTRALLGTLGHGTPVNLLERAASRNLQLRWLHRWLWGEHNEVDIETPHVLSLLPLEDAVRDDPLSQWSRVAVPDLAPPAVGERYYLHANRELSSAQPAPSSGSVRVEQILDPNATSFTPGDYFDDPTVRALAAVLAACPLDDEVWEVVLPADAELVGSCRLQLALTSNHAEWMVAAALTVEPVGGSEVMLSHGAFATRSGSPGTREVHELALPPIATALPAGATLRLRLRNLWLHEFPMSTRLATAPLFHDFAVDVELGSATPDSWIELPLRAPAPHLVVAEQTLALSTADPVAATVRGGIEHAGDPYFVAIGLSGSVPETPYLNSVIPLDGDWLVVQSAASTHTFYNGFIGFLDSAGEAQCGIDFSSVAPLPQLINGRHLTMAAFVWDDQWAPTGASSNACEILLR